MKVRLIHPEDPQDRANVEAGSADEEFHRARGLVEEGELASPSESVSSEEPAKAPARRGNKSKRGG